MTVKPVRRNKQVSLAPPETRLEDATLNSGYVALLEASHLLAVALETDKAKIVARAKELFEMVGIRAEYLSAYPHQLSGGMKQRVVIAIALALEPKLVIMDEPTTALDVVVQRSILQEIDAVRRRLNRSIIFITHDLSLLVEMSDRVAIIYAGEIVELAPSTLTHCTRTRAA